MPLSWWFLVPRKNVRRTGDPHSFHVEVALGEGRSGHTWRDLRHTLDILARFVKEPLRFQARLTDECDGHRGVVKCTFLLVPALGDREPWAQVV